MTQCTTSNNYQLKNSSMSKSNKHNNYYITIKKYYSSLFCYMGHIKDNFEMISLLNNNLKIEDVI